MVVDGIAAGIRCAIRPIIARRTGVRKLLLRTHFAACSGGPTSTAGRPLPTSPPMRVWVTLVTTASGRKDSIGVQSIGIHANDIDTIPVECIHYQWKGLVSIAIQFIAYQWTAIDCRARRETGRGYRERSTGAVYYNAGNVRSPGGKIMSSCVACGSELEPPVRAPHTVYVKTLYRIGGQEYCRHHIVRAAVAAVVITEVKPGPGPAAATTRGAPSIEYDRPHQY